MTRWIDELLEELQRRQAAEDARREGRPTNGGGPTGEPPYPSRRRVVLPEPGRWRRFAILFGIVLLLLIVGGPLATFFTELAWFGALGRQDVFATRLWSQVGLFVLGVLLFALPAAGSILLARRIAPQVPVRRIGRIELPDASPAITAGLLAVAVVFGLISGGAWSGHWETILLFLNGGPFGATDAHFGKDIGFYVFDLPFWRFVLGWATTSLLAMIGLTLASYAAGALRWQFRLSAPVRAHLSILGALLLGAFTAGYQLDIAELSYSTRGIDGTIQALTYTDLHAAVPAFWILTGVAVLAALLLLLNIWFRTLWALTLAGGAWLVASVLVGGVYPGFVQVLTVEPNELDLERPFIAEHIGATRAAFDLDAIDVRNFSGEQPLTASLISDNQATLDNLRLWDYRPLLVTFGQQQIVYQYYQFLDVDIDRYEIDGELRQIMLSPREIGELPESARTWTNERLVFTHGYGITAVPVNGVTPEGQPDYLVSGINREPRLPVGEPRIYFGEAPTSYVVSDTRTDEFDYPIGDQGSQTTTWAGDTGVGIGDPLSRLLFAVRFGDLNLLISNQLTDGSQILFHRQITERVNQLAPFLAYDRDPYLVSADGRLTWIWDAYTTTNRYPNAQPLADLFPGANYVRNSVKVAVDAYDGSVRFFVTDPDEPIIAAYARIFPSLFEPISAMPAALQAHLRYPEDLFTAQNEAYLLYHVGADEIGAETFYNQADRWAFPNQQTDVEGEGRRIEPYYVIMKLPDEEDAEFILVQPLVRASRPNMISWVAARMDPGHYGERISFRFPADSTTLGPAQVQARINQDSTISAQFTLWSRAGSSVVRGDLLVLPMGDSILYVEPIFLRSTESSFPEFKRVIFASQNRLAFAETIEEGLAQLLGAQPPPDGELPDDVGELVARAQELYQQAQAALLAGDLGTSQARIAELAEVLDRLAELVGAEPSPEASPAPSG